MKDICDKYLHDQGILHIYYIDSLITNGTAKMKTRLRDLRLSKGYTQLKVAIDLHMNQNTVSRYENDEREAGYDVLCLFADYYKVSVDYILRRTDDPGA